MCMKTVEKDSSQRLRRDQNITISIPGGLFGFEEVKQYRLVTVPEEQPLMWLEMQDRPHHGFLVVSPPQVVPEYSPQISQPDLDFLGVKNASELLLLNIVMMRNGEAFANLKGPIVINQRTLVGKQCVPSNVFDFSIEHPIRALPIAA
jgi:flagellar assembly factor FliW